MKKELKDIILNSIPKKYHRKVMLVIEKYDDIQVDYYFRINVLIILTFIVLMLLCILKFVCQGS